MRRTFSMVKTGALPFAKKSSDDLYQINFVTPTPHSLDEIWGALVKPEKVAVWMRPVHGKLSKGGDYAIGDLATGKISACEPKRRLALTMQRAGAQQDIEITFSETGKGQMKTRNLAVKVTAKKSDLPEDAWGRFGPAAMAIGWELLAKSLFDYMGDPKNPPLAGAFANFAASAEGRAYLDEAFAAWRKAAVAGGEGGEIMGQAPASLLGLYSGLHP